MGTVRVGPEVTAFERAIDDALKECRSIVFAHRHVFGEDWLRMCSLLGDGDGGEAAATGEPAAGHELIGRVLAAGLEGASEDELRALLMYEAKRAWAKRYGTREV